jgi:hypothetical protein
MNLTLHTSDEPAACLVAQGACLGRPALEDLRSDGKPSRPAPLAGLRRMLDLTRHKPHRLLKAHGENDGH